MSNKICLKKQEIEKFLEELKNIINSKEFNINTDLDILMKKSTERNKWSIYNTKYINIIKFW